MAQLKVFPLMLLFLALWVSSAQAKQFRFNRDNISKAGTPDLMEDDDVFIDVLEQPSVGLFWQFYFDHASLAILSDTYTTSNPANVSSAIVGGTQTRTIRFVGLAKNTSARILASKVPRAWDSNGRPSDSFNVSLNVKQRSRNAPSNPSNGKAATAAPPTHVEHTQSTANGIRQTMVAQQTGFYDPRSISNFPAVRDQVYASLGELENTDWFDNHSNNEVKWVEHTAILPWLPSPSVFSFQGNCGSCWAFATVGQLEVMYATLRPGQPVPDLSEQFLVSCNANSYSCNGGAWSHEYHFTTLVSQETQAGAIAESTMPYTATDGNCNNHPYSHIVKLSQGTTYIASDSATIMANIDKVHAHTIIQRKRHPRV